MYRLGLKYRKNIILNPVSGMLNQLYRPGFFDWFSAPSEVAHLATVKEQSRENIKRRRLVAGQLRKRVLAKLSLKVDNSFVALSEGRPVSASLLLFLFSKASKKQYLPVLAMSTLTTSDLEESFRFSIVTSVDDHQSFNTAAEELNGEESRMANVLTVKDTDSDFF